MIPDDEVERVRESADIVGIIGEFVALKRTGADFRGPCPFHQGKDRNLSVSARRRLFKCFVCGAGGDVFTFLQKHLGVDWPAAVRMAAEKSGIELREVNSRRDGQGPDPREKVWEMNAAAQEFFVRALAGNEGAAAREYVAKREITDETAQRFGLGFSPSDAGALRTHLESLGFDPERQLDAGLLVRREDSDKLRPRFRGRLMFPILGAPDRIAGFGGRVLGQGEPKYLNSPDSVAFSKGKLLYGMTLARNAIRRAERVFLVEGYFDLIRLSQAGIEEVVAPLGTALTPDQAELIVRLTRNVFLLYDSDRPGLKATFRAGDELLAHGAEVRVVTLPSGEDPDTFVRQHGRDGLEREVSHSIDVFERKIQLLERGGWFVDLHKRRRAIDRLLPTMRATVDPVTRDLYIGRVAQVSGLDRNVLANEVSSPEGRRRVRQAREPVEPMDEPRSRTGPAPERPRRRPPVSGVAAAERELVRVMLIARPLIERVGERIGVSEFRDPAAREIFAALLEVGPEAGISDIAERLSADAAEVMSDFIADPDAILQVERTMEDCLSQIEELTLKEKNLELQRDFGTATETEKVELMRQRQENAEAITRIRQRRLVS